MSQVVVFNNHYELPQFSLNKEARQLELERVIKHKEIMIRTNLPTQINNIPPMEHNLFLSTTRQMQINYMRWWISWAVNIVQKMVCNDKSLLDKHLDALWLFPKPSLDEVLRFPLNDYTFAAQRFCGPFHSSLTVPSSKYLQKLGAVLPDVKEFQRLLTEGRLFMSDHTTYSDYTSKAYVPKSMCFFICDSCHPTKFYPELFIVDSKVITKDNRGKWEQAKACHQAAEFIHYVVINRTCCNFLFLEPIVIYFYSSVSSSHPLYSLLNPIFYGHMNACYWVRKLVIAKDGAVNYILPLTKTGVKDLVRFAYTRWSFDNMDVKKKLASRGMSNVAGYSYSEDAQELIPVIREFITEYLGKIYREEREIINDYELQTWLANTADGQKGKVKGFPSSIDNMEALIDLFTQLFFMFVFERYFLNLLQYDHMAFLPTVPVSIKPEWDHRFPVEPGDLLRLIGTEDNTVAQLYAMFVMTYEILSPPKWNIRNLDNESIIAFEKFQGQLATKKQQMRTKCASRPSPFKYFIHHTTFLE